MRNLGIRFKKLGFCATRPATWSFLRRGIAPTVDHRKALQHLKFGTVLDVGANRGQFALFSRLIWPGATILCFEPLRRAREAIEGAFGSQVRVIGVALSDAPGEAEMFVTEHDDSSSLLPIGSSQMEISGTRVIGNEKVPVTTLDDALANEALNGPVLLKIDVQGGELEALKGARAVLPNIETIYVECSYISLYDGQSLASDVIDFLTEHSFRLAGVFNQVETAARGPVQADFLFQRGA